jgi:lipopolysaccharide export system permease protein
MIGGTFSRYVGFRFLTAVASIFAGLLVLVALIDFIEMLRRTGDIKDVSALYVAKMSLYRVPFLAERIMPFAVLVAAMFSYLNLSRRLELVIARAAGVSAWQFIAPSMVIALLVGVAATTLYNPLSAMLREQSARIEGEIFRGNRSFYDLGGTGFWVRQRSDDGQSIINAKTSRRQGLELAGVSVFRLDEADGIRDRIEAKTATLQAGYWRLEEVRFYAEGVAPVDRNAFDLATYLTPAQVRESFATPDTVPFWQLGAYIRLAENSGLAAAGYRVQYYQLWAQPLYLAAMVLLATAVSLRLFRFGGVQKMILGGIGVGFLLYVLSKVTADLSKAGLIPPLAAAGLPPLIGGLTGLITLLYQEDG